jgi:sec-independent protein translocase protein TatB
MFGLGTSEILFILLLALIFFKAEDLPKVARSVGRFMNELRRGSEAFQAQLFEADKIREPLDAMDRLMDEIENKLTTPPVDQPASSHPPVQASTQASAKSSAPRSEPRQESNSRQPDLNREPVGNSTSDQTRDPKRE